ncbi:hypothetical protein ACB098_02G083600 [Castanea mollissima]
MLCFSQSMERLAFSCLFLFISLLAVADAGSIGVNYGRIGDGEGKGGREWVRRMMDEPNWVDGGGGLAGWMRKTTGRRREDKRAHAHR